MPSSTKVVKSAEKPPNAGKGRQKGSVNKTTAALKDAILMAAESLGENMNGKDGLTGYLRFLGASEPKAFAGLLGKVLPMQVTGEGGGALKVVFETVYEGED